MGETLDSWPAGANWVFQGTVAEDATAGTHVSSLTVTPGAGNEIEVLYYQIIDGNTATSQTLSALIDDGTNEVLQIQVLASTSALIKFAGPGPGINLTSTQTGFPTNFRMIVSGTMRFILKVTTAAVSVTQTFAVACRIKGAVPTATLLDTIGTSTNTTNTSKVF